jgi:hypothetical protein
MLLVSTILASAKKIEAILFVFGECRVAMLTANLSSCVFCKKKTGHNVDDIKPPYAEFS